MKEEVTKLIETMCSKLGVGVEMVWSAMLRQAPLWGCSKLVTVVFSNVVFSFMLYFLIRFAKNNKIFSNDDCELDDSVRMITIFAIIIITFIIASVTINFLAVDFSMVLASFFNPEYWAASTLLKLKN